MASLAVYARRFPPDRFATLAGLQFGIGTIGTLMATAPLAFSTAAIGWRGSFLLVGHLHVRGRRADRLRGARRPAGAAFPRGAVERKHGRHRGGDSHALGRAALSDESRGLFVIRDDRRPVGRPLPDAHLRLHAGGTRQPAAHSGGGADHRLVVLGADGSGVQGLQAAGSDRRRRQRRLSRLSGGVGSPGETHPGCLVRDLRFPQRLRAIAGRTWPVAVSASSRRSRTDGSQCRIDGRHVSRAAG